MTIVKNAKDMADKRLRSQSGTAYPYFNLDTSIKVASVIHERGGGSCSADQLASFLGYSGVRNGTYLTRISSAKLFGLIISQGDRFGLSELGRSIISPIMPDDCVKAKVDAFLLVPLFAQIYEEFKGRMLPPEGGMKNLFETKFRIVKDRIAPAIRVFYESSEQAGFFALTGDRTKLIAPLLNPPSVQISPTSFDVKEAPVYERSRGSLGGSDGLPPLGIHPAIAGLLRDLPPPGKWLGKIRFMKAFQNTLDFIYPDDEDSLA